MRCNHTPPYSRTCFPYYVTRAKNAPLLWWRLLVLCRRAVRLELQASAARPLTWGELADRIRERYAAELHALDAGHRNPDDPLRRIGMPSAAVTDAVKTILREDLARGILARVAVLTAGGKRRWAYRLRDETGTEATVVPADCNNH